MIENMVVVVEAETTTTTKATNMMTRTIEEAAVEMRAMEGATATAGEMREETNTAQEEVMVEGMTNMEEATEVVRKAVDSKEVTADKKKADTTEVEATDGKTTTAMVADVLQATVAALAMGTAATRDIIKAATMVVEVVATLRRTTSLDKLHNTLPTTVLTKPTCSPPPCPSLAVTSKAFKTKTLTKARCSRVISSCTKVVAVTNSTPVKVWAQEPQCKP